MTQILLHSVIKVIWLLILTFFLMQSFFVSCLFFFCFLGINITKQYTTYRHFRIFSLKLQSLAIFFVTRKTCDSHLSIIFFNIWNYPNELGKLTIKVAIVTTIHNIDKATSKEKLNNNFNHNLNKNTSISPLIVASLKKY